MSPVGLTEETAARPTPRWLFGTVDLVVTLLLWCYFTIGFVLFFAPFYLLHTVFPANRQHAFQRLNARFYQGFLLLCRLLMPWQTWQVDPAIRAIRSSVVMCNHISYMDSILLISLFPQHTTVVKNRLFSIPIMRWLLLGSGYLPATSDGPLGHILVRQASRLQAQLAEGPNLIVFPEGTRSYTGEIGPFNKGAFKLARLGNAPVAVLLIRGTNQLFTPGKFLFNTCRAHTIRVELLDHLNPDYASRTFSIDQLVDQVRARYPDRV